MKRMLVLCVIAAALACSSAYASYWTNGSGDGDWGNSLNWDTPPVSLGGSAWVYNGTTAMMSGTQSATLTVYTVVGSGTVGVSAIEMRDSSNLTSTYVYMANAGSTACVGEIRLKDTSTLTISGGYLEMGQIGGRANVYASGNSVLDASWGLGIFIGNYAGTIGDLRLSENASAMASQVIVGQCATGYMTISDTASLVVNGSVLVGNYSVRSIGVVTMSGGSLSATGLNIGGLGKASLIMTGGVITLSGALSVNDIADGGTINVSGGTINADDLYLGGYFDMMTVSGSGKVILTGDKMDKVANYIATSYLTVGAYYLSGGNTYLVPEPASMLLFGLGSLIFVRRNRR